jgi:hypothetical protein
MGGVRENEIGPEEGTVKPKALILGSLGWSGWLWRGSDRYFVTVIAADFCSISGGRESTGVKSADFSI